MLVDIDEETHLIHPRDRSRRVENLLFKLLQSPLDACVLPLTLVWILTGVLTLFLAIRFSIKVALHTQSYGMIGLLTLSVLEWIYSTIERCESRLSWSKFKLLLVVVALSAMLTVLDVLLDVKLAFVYCGIWRIALNDRYLLHG